jgi:hypothetical protein
MKEQISEAISVLSRSEATDSGDLWIRPYVFDRDVSTNQFVLFLKPEATAIDKGVRVERILEIVFDALQKWDVHLGAVRVLNYSHLHKYRIMDKHYGVINEISRRGISAISDDAKIALQRIFESELKAGAVVLGGHQFLEKVPAFSAFALSTVSDNIGSKKLAGGTYCLPLRVSGETLLVLNGFHPYQLEHFTSPGKAIVVMECSAKTSWANLRQQLIGATNPTNAAQGSIRRILLEKIRELGMEDVNQGANGIHLSAGPLEGMVEIQRFFSQHDGDSIKFLETSFGALLLQKGFSEDQVGQFTLNPFYTYEGRSVSAFDLTEELDGIAAAEKLADVTNRSS